MIGKNNLISIFFIVTFFSIGLVEAELQKLTQPIGILVRTWEQAGPLPFPITPPVPTDFTPPTTPIEEVNYICAQWDNEVRPDTVPYDVRYPATEIKLTEQQHFVRLLGLPSSSANGAWIMRSEYVRGRTPQQLRDIFALPRVPMDITNVEMPASPDPVNGPFYVLWTGYAGPIRDWGKGGGVQNRLVADFGTNYFGPDYLFTNKSTRNHRQPIGQVALSYKPLAGCGNNRKVAQYLDSFIPPAYSDLENMYHALDYINYIGFGCQPLQNALYQVGPERFDVFSSLNFRNALLFSDSIFDRRIFCHQKNHFCEQGEVFEKCCKSKSRFGLEALGEFDQFNHFHGQTGGLLGYINFQSHKNVVMGISVAGMYNNLHGVELNDKAHGENIKLGFYVSYLPKSFFIDCLICGGFNWNNFSRVIRFYNVNRKAHSNNNGEDIEFHLQGGFDIGDLITPIARISYLFNKQNHFKENGAGSLNLDVKGFDTHILRTNLGVRVSHVINNSDVKIIPQANMFWVNDFYLNTRKISAKLCSRCDNFYVLGEHKTKSYFSGGLGCNFLFSKCCTLLMSYDAEVRSHFTAQLLRLGVESKF